MEVLFINLERVVTYINMAGIIGGKFIMPYELRIRVMYISPYYESSYKVLLIFFSVCHPEVF